MNNEQIDNTDYYLLPNGKYLEDFILYKKLNFAWGSALKYWWRAGKKDGESAEKDLAKYEHYVRFIAARMFHGDMLHDKFRRVALEQRVRIIVMRYAEEARAWK